MNLVNYLLNTKDVPFAEIGKRLAEFYPDTFMKMVTDLASSVEVDLPQVSVFDLIKKGKLSNVRGVEGARLIRHVTGCSFADASRVIDILENKDSRLLTLSTRGAMFLRHIIEELKKAPYHEFV